MQLKEIKYNINILCRCDFPSEQFSQGQVVSLVAVFGANFLWCVCVGGGGEGGQLSWEGNFPRAASRVVGGGAVFREQFS